MRRSLGVVLAASLLVNVFAAGAIGGGLFMLSRPGVWRSPPIVAGPQPIRSAGMQLPPPDRRRFRQTMRRVVEDSADLVRTARESRREAAQLFMQPDFDQAAVSAALERARNADVLLRTRLEAAAVDFAANLPADERALLAQGLERGGPLRRPRQASEAPKPP